MLNLYDPAPSATVTTAIPDPLARADALERDIADLCARINAASYRLLQLRTPGAPGDPPVCSTTQRVLCPLAQLALRRRH